jgi:hypothetical protein
MALRKIYPKFIANALEAFDMGSFTADQAVPGSRAVVRLGRNGVTAVEIDSSVDALDELTWNGTTLTIDLAQASIDALEIGVNNYQVTIYTASNRPLNGPRGEFVVETSLPPPA